LHSRRTLDGFPCLNTIRFLDIKKNFEAGSGFKHFRTKPESESENMIAATSVLIIASSLTLHIYGYSCRAVNIVTK